MFSGALSALGFMTFLSVLLGFATMVSNIQPQSLLALINVI